MIDIIFDTDKFDVSQIPIQWREYVTQTSLANGIKRVSIGIQPDDSSYRYRALMQKPQLVLKFALPFFFEFPVGTNCTFQNQQFTLMRAQDLKKQGTRKIEYSMTLYTNEYYFSVWKLRNAVDPVVSGENAPKDNRLKFSLCAKPHEFIDLIVRNLNKKDTSVTWSRGECIEASEKTVEFNHTYIDAALVDVCNVFNTEYEVEYIDTTQAKIHLRRVEYFKSQPIALSYGIGNGFIPGVGRTSEQGGEPVKRMLVQGSDRNIDRSKYGSPELLLPKSQMIRYDGEHFEDEDGFNSAIARTYKSNADGDGVERFDIVSSATKEDSLDCSEIYPSRVGVVTSVEVANVDKNFYDFIDNTIPSNLNFNNYLIAGETMTVIFQDGMLAGKEFDVKYKHEERRFEIVPQEIDGIMMPNATWCPAEEQTYAIFGIQLPDEYICDNTSKSGGSWDMMRAAVKALYECEDQKFTFTGSLQSLWTKRHWLHVGGYLIVGGHVLFKDEQFAKDGVVIRIVGIKDFLTQPYSPTIELSNSVAASSSVSSQIRQITNTEVVIEDAEKRMLQFTKRRFRDAKETIEMLEDAQLDMFTNSISPIAVQTMSLLIGDESLQFIFVSKSGDKWVQHTTPVVYDNEKKQLLCTMVSGNVTIYLQHQTLGHDAVTTKARNDAQGYKTWAMPNYTSPVLTETSKRYYLYAKCPYDTNQSGTFELKESSVSMDAVANYYYLLVGILNSEVDGTRSFAPMHGFTEILPGRITTERIVSSDGNSFFDLVENSFKLGDNLEYNIDESDTLRLRGAMVQSSSGDISPLPCYRGEYSSTTYYYNGDVVTCTSNNITSTYICITKQNGIVGISPLVANSHWKVYAKGAKGEDGAPGQNAPVMVFVGNYDTTRKYYGNAARIDCVRFGNAYYITKTNAPNGVVGFSGIDPDNSNYWQSFGASFESIATGMLLAENANIGNLIFRNQRLESTAETNDEPNIIIDGLTGNVKFGWLRTIGSELLGFDSNGIQRLRITPWELPIVNTASTSKDLKVKSNGGDATFTGETDTEVSFEQEVHCYGSDDIEMNFYGWVEFDIDEDNTLVDLSGIQFGCSVKRTGSSNYEYLSCSMSAYVQRKNGSTWENIGSVSLNSGNPKITIPKAGRIRIEFLGSVNDYIGYDCSGTFSMATQGVKAITAKTEMIIAKDGFMAIYNSNYMRFHSNDGLMVKMGNQHFRINASGIAKSVDGTTWTNL